MGGWQFRKRRRTGFSCRSGIARNRPSNNDTDSRCRRSRVSGRTGGSVAVAAAEVVATAKGKPPQAVPGQIATWVSKIDGSPSTEMSDLACRAVERVRTNSELKDLWLEADGLNEWSAALRDLEARLRS